MRHRRNLATVLLLAGALAACDAGGNGAQDTLATTPPTLTLPASTSTSAADSTTSTQPTATVPDGAIALSADGPWRLVDSAPGITTPGLVYELMPGLWVYLPTVEDIPHGITWVLNEDDRPVIEAYLMAQLTYYRSITVRPMDLGNPDWDLSYTESGRTFFTELHQRDAEGQVAEMDAGVVLRPQVLGEERTDTTAVVFDCILDGGVFLTAGGALAPGSTRGVVLAGSGSRLAVTDGRWKVVQVGTQEDAC